MSKLIFFDTETTGNTEKDFLCQIAYKTTASAKGSGESKGEEVFVGYYKPPIKIPPEASAVHHITNKRLENELQEQQRLEQLKLTASALDAQVKERNTLGIELHDNVNQILVGTNILLSLIKKPPLIKFE